MTPEFRVWNKRIKTMITDYHISYYDDVYGVLLSDVFDDSQVVFEQYTGLKDVNGNKIFEGDIVHGYDQEPDREDGYIGSSVVEVVNFVDGAFWLGNIKYQIMLCTPPIIEVIGNIHENPELLEVDE